MKRDMDIIRRIVLATADMPPGDPLGSVPGVSPAEFAVHAQWLHEAGLVQAALIPSNSMKPATMAMIWRLTWQGCEFADAIRSDTLWAKAKTKVLTPSASWTFGILLDWLKSEISSGLPKISL